MRSRRFGLDWALLGLITLVCIVLSLLQWRWTGEFALAERVRLEAVLNEQTQHLAQAFDEELKAACVALLPSAAELLDAGTGSAHMSRWHDAREEGGAAWFQHVAVAIPNEARTGVRLFRIDGAAWREESWPTGWQKLHDAMASRVRAEGGPPAVEASTDLIEAPIFRGAEEAEWMIFEVSREHVQREAIPRLMGRFLNPGTQEAVFDAAVVAGDGTAVFGQAPKSTDAHAGIFALDQGLGLGGGGGGRGRRGGGRGQRADIKRWTLMTWHKATGSLQGAVTQARRRNLLTSLALISLMGVAAWALVQYTAKTRRLANLQMDFVAGVSHDLRTPLAAIRGAAFNIRGGLAGADALDRYGQLIQRNAEDLTGMIDNLLAYSVSRRGGTLANGKMERVNIDTLVERAARSIEQELEAFDGELEVDIVPGTPDVAGDALALERAMRNLLDNAARHGASGKWVGVTARPDDGMVEIRVKDHGRGVRSEEIPRIFDAFYRGDDARQSRVRGAGLGLSLVKETITRHGGSVRVENATGGGAEFVMRLPAWHEDGTT